MFEFDEQAVTPVRVWVRCGFDKTKLEFTGRMLSSYPPLYPHKCPKCEVVTNLNKVYPRIEYR